MKRKQLRQGDVFLRRIKAIPATATRQETKDRIVLAYDEVTGHAHATADSDAVDVFIGEDRMYLKVKEETALRHEEHAPVTIAPGNYERVIQQEYVMRSRNVAD